jgi:hypothetical protein
MAVAAHGPNTSNDFRRFDRALQSASGICPLTHGSVAKLEIAL